MNLATTAFAGAALALAMAAIAGLDIWITGRQGTARVVMGTVVALAILAIPAALWITSRDWPDIADVSTDVENPPDFTELASRRPEGSNSAAYAKDAVAGLQHKSYPDIKTLTVPRPAEETFELVRQALGKLKLRRWRKTSPRGRGRRHRHHRTCRYDDDLRLQGRCRDPRRRATRRESHIDVRSASEYGRNDFGRNAARIREILREIVGRLEASAPAEGRKVSKADDEKAAKGTLKRPKAVRRPSGTAQRKPDPSRSGTRRAPEPLE